MIQFHLKIDKKSYFVVNIIIQHPINISNAFIYHQFTMMFLNTQAQKNIENYISYLKVLGSFSNLFSSSNKPYIQYRVAENTFCKAFDAENLARADVAYDAIKEGYGIGIKTFILTGKSKIEKVAEFNSLSAELREHSGKELAKKLAEFRNRRIEFGDSEYEIKNRIYHIVGRDENVIKIFEESYDLIDIDSIEIISNTKSAFKFKDKHHEYSFNYSKSVLMKRFIVPDNCIEIPVDILDSPLEHLMKWSAKIPNVDKNEIPEKDIISEALTEELIPGVDYIILPLYSIRAKEKNKEPIVPLKSQLNQWNAGGRNRDMGEVYIPIPSKIHSNCPDFLPNRDTQFQLRIPNGESLTAKVCQSGSKALMTNPNNDLASWMLRRTLKLPEGEILDYERLRKVGYDSVKITRINNLEFLIDFAKINSYENFMNEF